MIVALALLLAGSDPALAQGPKPDFRSQTLQQAAPGVFTRVATARVVPQVVGLTLQEARQRLKAADLAGNPTEAPSILPQGTVISQRPGGGTSANGVSAVELTISDGTLVRTPNLVGQDEGRVASLLAEAQLVPGARRTEPSSSPEGVVMRSRPSAGATVPRNSPIVYYVAVPQVQVVMPDVTGMTFDDARAVLNSQQLERIRRIRAPFIPPSDVVTGQRPAAGSQVTSTTQITLVVSNGQLKPPPAGAGTSTPTPPPSRAMPQLVGMTVARALETLQPLGPGAINETYVDSTRPTGIVIGQSPQVGAAVGPQTQAQLSISNGSQVAVPRIAGGTGEQARQILAASDLRLGKEVREASATPPGRILRSIPAEGAIVPRKSAVAYVVARAAPIAVPDVTGLSEREAIARLKAARLQAARAPTPSGLQTRDEIAEQKPVAGAQAPVGSTVSLTLAEATPVVPPPDGPTGSSAPTEPPKRPPPTVPSVVAKSEFTAITTLENAGYQPHVRPSRFGYWRADKVAEQSPRAGAPLAAGSPVELIMAETLVPAFAGAGGVIAVLAALGYAAAWPLRLSILPALDAGPAQTAEHETPAATMPIAIGWRLEPQPAPQAAESWAEPVDPAFEIRMTWEVATGEFEAAEDQGGAPGFKEGSDA
ncbi:MAG TPA: PASTA domain-containing protein [Phenylobacterium sp.]